MDAKRNSARLIPKMAPLNIHHATTKKRRSSEDVEDQRVIMEQLKMNQQTDRAFSKNAEGKLRIPRTACWERLYRHADRHILNCGHVAVTKTKVLCGSNCVPLVTGKHHHQGKAIVCQKCVDKARAAVFIPRKRARAATMPSKVQTVQIDEPDALFMKQDEDTDLELASEQLQKTGQKKPKVLFEPLLPPNPRKRRAVDEPDFEQPDYPTGSCQSEEDQ